MPREKAQVTILFYLFFFPLARCREESIIPDDHEEVNMNDYDPEAERHRRRGRGGGGLGQFMDDDDDDHHGHGPGVSCATQ